MAARRATMDRTSEGNKGTVIPRKPVPSPVRIPTSRSISDRAGHQHSQQNALPRPQQNDDPDADTSDSERRRLFTPGEQPRQEFLGRDLGANGERFAASQPWHLDQAKLKASPDVSINEGKISAGYTTLDTQRERNESREPLDNSGTTTRKQSMLAVWWKELASLLALLGSLAAVVATVRPAQGQPVPEWPLNISINALVAVYIVILKIVMIYIVSECLGQLKWSWFEERTRSLSELGTFDDASRGPWGAICLVWKTRGQNFVPPVGALIVILSTILDPFGQQIISLRSCTLPASTGNATIPRNSFVRAGTGGRHLGAGISSISLDMQAVINTAIFNNPEPRKVTPFCPTGNCVFGKIYHSGGWCNECKDITDQLVITESKLGTNFTLPSTNLTTSPVLGQFGIGIELSDGEIPGLTIQTILGASVNGSDFLVEDDENPWAVNGHGAAECSFHACVHDLQSEVTTGNLTESIVSTSMEWSNGGGGFHTSVDLSCTNDTERQILRDAGYDFGDDNEWLGYNLTRQMNYDNATDTFSGGSPTDMRVECLYQVFYVEIDSLWQFLGDLFSGVFHIGPYGQGPSILEAVYQEGNISFKSVDQLFHNIAVSMTAFARERADNDATGLDAQGAIYTTDTCVEVRWAWLTFPASLALGTMIFLAGTMWKTQRGPEGKKDYKTSVLPLLLHPLEKSDKGFVSSRQLNGMAAIKREAKEIKVRLRSSEDTGWKFVEQERPLSSRP
ncbi:hypothetical protein MKZ38_009160 [Zalerion maritima]|uniref:Uncharacterized protein n=1 Tax=Zalerion maritima TaxID=339359 RepID=A0AAD5RGZ2_9PEZI|nr:hypothetical protein MKZ38_009160 [Zalerion maritima]